MRNNVLVFVLLLITNLATAQLIIPTEPTNKSAELQVESADKAVLFPRLTTSEINAISNPAHGLLIYNVTKNAFVYNIGSETVPQWQTIGNLLINSSAEIQAIPTPTSGDMRYNSTTKSVFYYNGITKVWEEICEDPQCQAFSLSNTIISHAHCFGVANGSAQVDITGGTGPFTFAWSDAGSATQSRTDLLAGAYTITVTDSKGCSKTTSLTINEPSEIQYTVSITDADCRDTANGSITVSALGGSGSFNYSNNGGVTWQSNSLFANLLAGSYSILVRDNAVPACLIAYSGNPVVVAEPAVLSMSVAKTNADCFGVSNGEIAITPSGGSGNYESTSDNGANWQIASTHSSLAAGSYNVLLRDPDASNCFISYPANPVAITQPAEITYSVAKTDISTNGADDGQITISASGGSAGNFEYSINGGLGWQASNIFSNLTPGDYNVVVRDADVTSCEVSYVSNPVSVEEPGAINISVAKQNVNCNGANNGSITITATSTDVTNFEYSVDGGINWYALNTFSNLPPTTYSISVRDRDNITNFRNYNLNPVSISEPTALTVSIFSTDADCFGDSNGSIEVTAGGGSGSYGYSNNNGSTWQASNVFNGLSAGNYNVVIRDANATSCQLANASNPIAVPDELLIVETITDVSCHSANDGTKNDGAIDVIITGGNGGNSYSWANGTGSGTDNTDGANQSGLIAGTYSVTVTDSKGCTKNETYTVNQPVEITFDNITVGIVSCHTNNSGTKNDGSITVSASGGTGALSYSWTDGTGTGSNNGNGANQTGLTAGTYSVQISDTRSCSETQSNISVGQPSEFIASISASYPKDVSCAGNADGEIRLEATGGTGSAFDVQIQDRFTYINNLTFPLLIDSLSGFSSKNISVRDENNCVDVISNISVGEPGTLTASSTSTPVTCNGDANGTISLTVSGGNIPYSYVWTNAATTKNISGLSGNTYTVTITDSKACSFILSETVTEPAVLSLSSTVTHVTCFNNSDGAVDANVSGGNGSYTYLWNNGITTQDLSGVDGGSYTLTVTDSKGCSANITSAVNEPAVLTASAVVTNVTCNGNANGAVAITPTGGNGSNTYSWSNGASTEDISSLSGGTYTVTITDSKSCTFSLSRTVNEPAVLTASAVVTNVTCNGNANGAVAITPTGGNGSNTYSWSNGASTEDISSLVAGTYTVTITDSKSCTFSLSRTITEPSSIAIATTVTDVACNGTLGSVLLDASGGNPFGGNTYEYSNDNATWTSNVATKTYSSLSAGSYTFYARDISGCTKSVNVSVGGSPALTISFANVDNEATCGEADAGADVVITGGTPFGNGFDFNWDGIGNDRQLSGYTKVLSAGLHTLVVTDAGGCTDDATLIVNLPDITFTDDGTGVAEFSSGNEAYWKFKRCSDPAITTLACNCGGTLFYWDETYDYFVSAGGNVLMPNIGGCTSVNTASLYGHPDEGSLTDTDGDGVYDYNSDNPTTDEIDFRNASINNYQFDPNGTDNVYDKDNLLVSPAVLLPGGDKIISFYDNLSTVCNGAGDCDIIYGSAVAYCPRTTNEAGDAADLYTSECEVDGTNLQQSMEGRPTLCTDAFGYGWRVPTIQEMRYSYDLGGSADIAIDAAYYGHVDNDGVGFVQLLTATKTAPGNAGLTGVQTQTFGDQATGMVIPGPGFNSTGGGYYVRCVFDSDLPVWQTNADCN